MSKTHAPYAPEYRRQMVEFVHAGRAAEKQPDLKSTVSADLNSRDRGEGDTDILLIRFKIGKLRSQVTL